MDHQELCRLETTMVRQPDFLFDKALECLASIGGTIIVEIGSIRNPDSAWALGDGHSTLAWAKSGLPTWTIDHNILASLTTRKLLSEYTNVKAVHSEGIRFLRKFKTPIDLLYLDGPAPFTQRGDLWTEYAFKAAPLASKAVLLIDDTDFPEYGKGRYTIPLAIERGFKLVQTGRQSLLVRS
jgi:hypothetical protein